MPLVVRWLYHFKISRKEVHLQLIIFINLVGNFLASCMRLRCFNESKRTLQISNSKLLSSPKGIFTDLFMDNDHNAGFTVSLEDLCILRQFFSILKCDKHIVLCSSTSYNRLTHS